MATTPIVISTMTNTDVISSFMTSFNNVFSPLAHHLFPEGNKDLMKNKSWPKKCHRGIVPPKDALESVRAVHLWAQRHGLTEPEQIALTTAACSSLGSAPVGPGSPLLNQTDGVFVDLIKCLLPITIIPFEVVQMIIASLPRCHTDKGKQSVFRFFSLSVEFNPSIQVALSKFYKLLFSVLLTNPSVGLLKDAVRLLHTITERKHVTPYRLTILQSLHNERTRKNDESVLLLLIHLYTRYHSRSIRSGSMNNSNNVRLYSCAAAKLSLSLTFPDDKWRNRFRDVRRKDTSNTSPYCQVVSFSQNRSNCCVISSLSSFDSASDIFDEGSFRFHLYQNKKLGCVEVGVVDENVGQCLYYKMFNEWHQNDNHQEIRRRSRMKLIKSLTSISTYLDTIPFSAVEEFVIEEMLDYCLDVHNHCGCHSKICQDEDILTILKLLSFLSPPGAKGAICKSFLHWKSLVLSPLAKACMGALHKNSKLFYDSIVHMLTPLLTRWELLKWRHGESHIGSKSPPNSNTHKYLVMKELVEWVDNLLLTGLVNSGRTKGNSSLELIRLSALHFYKTAALHLSTSFVVLAATPSPSLLYQLLLSDTALSVESVCGFLLTLKNKLESWKKQLRGQKFVETDNETKISFMFDNGTERVALYNCFIWDFCSVLWRCSLSEQKENSILLSDLSQDTLRYLAQQSDSTTTGNSRVGLSLSMASLSITHGATFSGFASNFLEQRYKQANDKGPPCRLSPDLLKGTWKVKYLDYLKEIGFVELHTFLTTFVGSLAQRESRKQKKRKNLDG